MCNLGVVRPHLVDQSSWRERPRPRASGARARVSHVHDPRYAPLAQPRPRQHRERQLLRDACGQGPHAHENVTGLHRGRERSAEGGLGQLPHTDARAERCEAGSERARRRSEHLSTGAARSCPDVHRRGRCGCSVRAVGCWRPLIRAQPCRDEVAHLRVSPQRITPAEPGAVAPLDGDGDCCAAIARIAAAHAPLQELVSAGDCPWEQVLPAAAEADATVASLLPGSRAARARLSPVLRHPKRRHRPEREPLDTQGKSWTARVLFILFFIFYTELTHVHSQYGHFLAWFSRVCTPAAAVAAARRTPRARWYAAS